MATKRGTAGRDILSGSSANDFLQGLNSHDTLFGKGGNDTLAVGQICEGSDLNS
jgi:Ca2+-binding RTX toxin-like protein